MMKAAKVSLNEVVIMGYGSVRKSSFTQSAVNFEDQSTISNALAGIMPGVMIREGTPGGGTRVMIRGNNTFTNIDKALIIVDGVVISQEEFDKIKPDSIADISLLKDAAATAIYGSRAASGVVIITTKSGTQDLEREPPMQAQTLRTNFSDVGFWFPKLVTDRDGNAVFMAKLPDDITNWKIGIIAMNGNKQIGFTESAIKAYKTLSANFVSPLFAVKGDQINVIGKLMNYSSTTEKLRRNFVYNGETLKDSELTFKNTHIDTISILATGKDSLSFEYMMKRDDGYFDGELRKIPLYELGVLETKGYFSSLLSDTTSKYSFEKNLGKVTVRAETSIFPVLLDEMTKLRNYEYLCNEQLASKLKSLLMEKKVRNFLKEPFNYEKDILSIIRKLLQNRKVQGTWGWWQQSDEEIWISLHVTEALLLAERENYKVSMNKSILYNYLIGKISQQDDYSKISTIKLLHLLDSNYYFKDWVSQIEKVKSKVKPTLYEQLQLMRLKQIAGMKIDTDSLLRIKKQTMFGSSYWGEPNNRFWDNSVQNSLSVYHILKAAGGFETELNKIQLYFLEQRKDGQWRNTYESVQILEAILPDLIAKGSEKANISIKINDETINEFPYTAVIEPSLNLKLTKKGTMPVYFTAFQQFQNPEPTKINKDFTVKSTFTQDGVLTNVLKAGKSAKLNVEVEVRADADYVMIEIPIPAGCSYENKVQNFWGIETHREYFKNKTSIFCNQLKQGTYTFTIDLMPRYGGNYVLNPAKAEMMYFPVFFGREGMKKMVIN